MYHEQLVKHNNLNTKMNLHNDDDNVNDGDIHVIIIMLAYNLHAHIMAVLSVCSTISHVIYARLCCVHCIWEVRCFPFSSSKFPSSQVECVHAHFPSKLGNKMAARITLLFLAVFSRKNSQWRNYLGGFTGLHD